MISLNGHIIAALTELKMKYKEDLPKCAVHKLEIIIKVSRCVHAMGSIQKTTKVVTVNQKYEEL